MRGLSFDHGASYVSAKPSDPKWKASPFARALRAAEKAGVAARWRGDVGVADADAATSRGDDVVMDEGSFEAFPPEKELFVGVPTMAALPLFIAETLARATKPEASHLGDNAAVGAPEYATNAFVQTLTEPQYPGGRWNLTARIRDGGHVWYKSIDADIVIVATSAPAAAILMPWRGLGSVDDVEVDDETFTGIVQGAAHGVEANACWTLCVAFEKSLDAPFDGVMMRERPEGGYGKIAWFCNNSSKPGRKGGGGGGGGWAYAADDDAGGGSGDDGDDDDDAAATEPECWVVQGSPTFCQNVPAGAASPRVADELLDAFLTLLGKDADRRASIEVTHKKAVKWKHAYPANPTGRVYFDPETGVAACGDWTFGGRTSDAYDSGVAVGKEISTYLELSREL
ncbi:uncharacterized protein MICPUCDRAFT_49755 [Micromonas pusilla CCMP1545]|uniref:Predicted protein n=2 Tax=Micromonas pusilla TaxID=38833 RepID=C1N7B9_MICPC|nr:uncharacterized protein MICPUCDRAFT_49755 [Micromonas pusilla CCMP1545]EEH52082.1 predicted protein [Micromonas pusilla CCMP1545]|eukprot:XP_003063709.1 predicted protein [Micromonas pusilla CCMP1545]